MKLFLLGFFLCLSTADYIPGVYLRAVKECTSMNYKEMQESLERIQQELLVARTVADGSYELYRLNAPQFKIHDTRDFCPSYEAACLKLLDGLQRFVLPIMHLKIFLNAREGVQCKSHEYESLYALCKLRESQHVLSLKTVKSYHQLQKILLPQEMHTWYIGLTNLVMGLSAGHLAKILSEEVMGSLKDFFSGKLELANYWAIINYFTNLLSKNSNKCALIELNTTIDPPERFDNPSRPDFNVAYRSYIWKKGQEYAKQAGLSFPVNLPPQMDSLRDEDMKLSVTHQQLYPGAIALAIKLLVLLDSLPIDFMWPLRHRIAVYLEYLEKTCIDGARDLLKSRTLRYKIHFSKTTIFFYSVRANPRMLPVVSFSVTQSTIAFNISGSLKFSVMKDWLNRVYDIEHTAISVGNPKELANHILSMLPAKLEYF